VDSKDKNGGNIYDDPPGGDSEQPGKQEKVKMLWFDGEANFKLFSSKSNVTTYLDLAKKTGFNMIVVDVRPVQGDVLYKSDFMPELKTLGGYTVDRDWDYLQFFVDEAHKRNLKVVASTCIFTAGLLQSKEGMAFRSNEWDDKLSVIYRQDGSLVNSKDNPSKTEAVVFLNPALPQVQEFVLKFITEIVTKYDIDGFDLDYCRYSDFTNDFSGASRDAFSRYIGETVVNFPADIFTYNPDGTRNPGKYYQKWWEFRSMTIHNFVAKVKQSIQAVKPKVKLYYWAASWYGNRYEVGQNWGSKTYKDNPSTWATPNYCNTGFAEELDVFLLGTYLNRIYGLDDTESIEYGIYNAKKIVNGACTMYGTIFANNHMDNNDKNTNIENAVYICLRDTPGLMVFDIVQVNQYGLWNGIKRGIDRAEAEK
jgi:uncharacterized lipoprotein YddW (UPF0748 family)